jgi:glycosyltransferase A (GT-A) superfamily protein (DUF2064 family)
MQIFNVGNTLPPLAVLALAMVVIGIGDTPAIIALFLARCCRSCATPTRAVLGPAVAAGSGKRHRDDQMAASASG